MVKFNKIILGLIAILVLSGCSNSNDKNKADRVLTHDIYGVNDQSITGKIGQIDLFFKANDDVPYVSTTTIKGLVSSLKGQVLTKEISFTRTVENNVVTLIDNNSNKCVINNNNQTITFEDFDAYNSFSVNANETLTLNAPREGSSLKLESKNYVKGKQYTIDLNKYDKIDIYHYQDDYFIPLATFNDLFLNAFVNVNLVYNFNDVFLISDASKLTQETLLGNVLTELGEQYYKGLKSETVSEGYAKYYYQEILLNFDYLYGLKSLRDYHSFDEYLSLKGYKEDLLSGDVHKMDNALAYALSSLGDGHTGLTGTSPLYKYGETTVDKSKYNQEKLDLDNAHEALSQARDIANAPLGLTIDEDNGVAFIAFDHFTPIDEEQLGQDSWSKEETLANSATLFIAAYNQLISDKYIGTIDKVVIDLATNEGGSADSLLYILGILLGECQYDVVDPFTGATNHTTYKVDINKDGKFDEKDISLREYGKLIYFLDTKFAFSCGNALPVFAKNNYPDTVRTIGQVTGGGTCIVRTSYSPLGAEYCLSGLSMLSIKDSDNNLTNIESGAKVDIPLDSEATTLNRTAVINAINAAK